MRRKSDRNATLESAIEIRKQRTLTARCMRTQRMAETPERVSHEESDAKSV